MKERVCVESQNHRRARLCRRCWKSKQCAVFLKLHCSWTAIKTHKHQKSEEDGNFNCRRTEIISSSAPPEQLRKTNPDEWKSLPSAAAVMVLQRVTYWSVQWKCSGQAVCSGASESVWECERESSSVPPLTAGLNQSIVFDSMEVKHFLPSCAAAQSSLYCRSLLSCVCYCYSLLRLCKHHRLHSQGLKQKMSALNAK